MTTPTIEVPLPTVDEINAADFATIDVDQSRLEELAKAMSASELNCSDRSTVEDFIDEAYAMLVGLQIAATRQRAREMDKGDAYERATDD